MAVLGELLLVGRVPFASANQLSVFSTADGDLNQFDVVRRCRRALWVMSNSYFAFGTFKQKGVPPLGVAAPP